MYIPDHAIVKKVRTYDPYLFINWNNEKEYFELWRRMEHGRRLITPITQSLFQERGKAIFAPLDERLLWVISDWDSWKKESIRSHTALFEDSRWMEFQKNQRQRDWQENIAKAKDIWGSINSFYATKYPSKNKRPGTREQATRNRLLTPDCRSSLSSRIFSRSSKNALQYNFKRGN